jgi:hypothetical protein
LRAGETVELLADIEERETTGEVDTVTPRWQTSTTRGFSTIATETIQMTSGPGCMADDKITWTINVP